MTLRTVLCLFALAFTASVSLGSPFDGAWGDDDVVETTVLAKGKGKDKKPKPTSYTPTGSYATAFKDGQVKDPARKKRTIAYRLTYPKNFTGSAPVIIISHGGSGDTDGEKSLAYLRLEFASRGYVVLNLNHLKSKTLQAHLGDRCADVSFVLDELFAKKIRPPAAFKGTMNLQHIGHAGHSWGSLTAIALAGGKFLEGTFKDSRISACAALSPQGRDKYGTYDNGPSDNTWDDITLPMYNFVGEGEVDGDCNPDEFVEPGWRLQPFERYPDHAPKYQSIVPDCCHASLFGYATEEQLRYIAVNAAMFFDAYLKGKTSVLSKIGREDWLDGVEFETKPAN